MATFDPTRSLPEVWHPIPRIPHYEISSHLRVRSLRQHARYKKTTPPRLIKIALDDRGYRKLVVWEGDTPKNRRTRNYYLHHIVAELVYGPCPPDQYVRHLDDDKANNWPDNLAYGTPTQNSDDAKRNGKLKVTRGERKWNAKLTDVQVMAARQLHRMGVPQRLIAFAIGVDPSKIKPILDGRKWAHVDDSIDLLADGRAYESMPAPIATEDAR